MLVDFFKQLALLLTDNWLLIATGLVIFSKFIVFLAILTSKNVSGIDILKGYYSIRSKLFYLAIIFLTLSPGLLLAGSAKFWFCLAANIFLTLLMIADLMYYRAYAAFISVHSVKIAAKFENLSSSAFSMLRPIDLIFIPDIVLITGLPALPSPMYGMGAGNMALFTLVVALSLLVIIYTHYRYDIKGKGKQQAFFILDWAPQVTMAGLSPIGYHLFDLYNYWQDRRPIELKPEDSQRVTEWFANNRELLPNNEYKSMLQGKNLIFIQVESLESFIIGQKIDGQEITPRLNALLKNSLYFSEVYEQVNEGGSSDADFMANTSVYPLRRGSAFFRFPYNQYNSLPKLLEGQGYSTLAIYPVKGSFWNWTTAMTAIGFKKCIDISDFQMDEVIGLGISDESLLRQIVPKLAALQQPFYTFMATNTSHGPFDLPQTHRELNLDKKLDETKLGGYFQMFRYTDKHIGNFIAALGENRLLDDTAIVIYGDHCGIHKYYQDELEKISPAESWWLENQRRIPLIIYSKNLQGQELRVRGGTIDIMPTVAYLMGLEAERYQETVMGRNLLKTARDFSVLADGTFIGKDKDGTVREHAVKGLEIADMLIRSNYFGS